MEYCIHIRLEFPFFAKKIVRTYLHLKKTRKSPENWFVVYGVRNLLRFFSNRIAIVAIKND